MIAHRQSAGIQSSGSVASLALAYSSNVLAGSLLVVNGCNESAASPSCTDSLGNTYTQADTAFNGPAQARVTQFFAGNIAAGGACTVTFDFTGSDFAAMSIHEYTGNWDTTPEQVSNNGTGSSGTAATGNLVTTTQTLIVAAMSKGFLGGAPTMTIDGTYTQRYEIETEDSQTMNSGDKVVAAGTYTGAWTISDPTANWAAVAAAYEEVVATVPSLSSWSGNTMAMPRVKRDVKVVSSGTIGIRNTVAA